MTPDPSSLQATTARRTINGAARRTNRCAVMRLGYVITSYADAGNTRRDNRGRNSHLLATVRTASRRSSSQKRSPAPLFAPRRLFAGDLRLAGRDRQHDAQADGDHEADDDPHRRDVTKHAAVPQREKCSDNQEEVADEVNVHVPHSRLLGVAGRLRQWL